MQRRRINLLFLFVAAFIVVITFNNFIFPSRPRDDYANDLNGDSQRAPHRRKPPIAPIDDGQQQHQVHEYAKPELDDDDAHALPKVRVPKIEQAGRSKKKPMGKGLHFGNANDHLVNPKVKPSSDAVEMVIATQHKENITWLHDYLQDWKKNIYVVDDDAADLTVPKNKGREAMVYLT